MRRTRWDGTRGRPAGGRATLARDQGFRRCSAREVRALGAVPRRQVAGLTDAGTHGTLPWLPAECVH
ncbi:hypothetical protein [Streptomyces sp. Je 1-332]|uniref:hypothetical protein n=1 Tax=Streptomyces sp. Je 1-332 TaxID=3231270 RepID=UPI00345A04A0